MDKLLNMYINNTLFLNRLSSDDIRLHRDNWLSTNPPLDAGANYDSFDNYLLNNNLKVMQTKVEPTGDENLILSLYGENAIKETLTIIKDIALNSNVSMDNRTLQLGLQFINHRCEEIINNEFRKKDLKHTVTESFGHAVMAMYQT